MMGEVQGLEVHHQLLRLHHRRLQVMPLGAVGVRAVKKKGGAQAPGGGAVVLQMRRSATVLSWVLPIGGEEPEWWNPTDWIIFQKSAA